MATSKNFELGSFANNVDHDPSSGEDAQVTQAYTLGVVTKASSNTEPPVKE
tara:strand:+ start:513 stop:665 length:153 start_codon:yes stop_codon:yes gene_type:complete